jgi:hypothetical protein
VSIPLVTTNRINDPQVAEDILARGDADMVSMARPFLADAEFMSKAQSDRADEINTCIGCNQACLDRIFVGKVTSCLVNPRACHETLMPVLPANAPKRLAVVGAGLPVWPLPLTPPRAAIRSRCLMRCRRLAASLISPNRSPAKRSSTKRCVTTAPCSILTASICA